MSYPSYIPPQLRVNTISIGKLIYPIGQTTYIYIYISPIKLDKISSNLYYFCSLFFFDNSSGFAILRGQAGRNKMLKNIQITFINNNSKKNSIVLCVRASFNHIVCDKKRTPRCYVHVRCRTLERRRRRIGTKRV